MEGHGPPCYKRDCIAYTCTSHLIVLNDSSLDLTTVWMVMSLLAKCPGMTTLS